MKPEENARKKIDALLEAAGGRGRCMEESQVTGIERITIKDAQGKVDASLTCSVAQ